MLKLHIHSGNTPLRTYIAAILALSLVGCSSQAPKKPADVPNKTATSSPKAINAANNQRESLWKEHQTKISQFTHWQAKGRIAASKASKGGNAQFVWQQNGGRYQLKLFGPWGAGTVHITGDNHTVELKESNGKITRAQSPELLLQKVAGWQVPIAGLVYWLRGIPTPQNQPGVQRLTNNGYLSFLQQQGWRIEYENYQTANAMPLPSKLKLQNGETKLKMIITDWKPLSS
jgi:outer membrane lipoprotein LolB